MSAQSNAQVISSLLQNNWASFSFSPALTNLLAAGKIDWVTDTFNAATWTGKQGTATTNNIGVIACYGGNIPKPKSKALFAGAWRIDDTIFVDVLVKTALRGNMQTNLENIMQIKYNLVQAILQILDANAATITNFFIKLIAPGNPVESNLYVRQTLTFTVSYIQ